MNKKTIVLADNSYTIRRIVELSFSEEEQIELVSFEDGASLKEKLLELRPAIVLVDIKLPEFSGYEVCKFINVTESLKNTKVFLLKGGFEPIDESLLTNLVYASIITKPFDSNALVATIKKMLSAPVRTPSSVPEATPAFAPGEMPAAGGLAQPRGGIDAGVKADMGTGGILGGSGVPNMPQYHPSNDVLPSEEITQGAQPEVDNLAPSREDDMANPFADDAPADRATRETLSEEELDIKMNIQQQERDLEIGSVTQEAMQIKQQIGDFGQSPSGGQAGPAAGAGAAPGTFGGLELDMPAGGQLGEPAGLGLSAEAPAAGSQPGVPVGEAASPPQMDGFLQQEQGGIPETPAMDKYPEIEQAFDGDDIDFETEISSDPGIMDNVPAPGEQPGFTDFGTPKGLQEPAAFEQPPAPPAPQAPAPVFEQPQAPAPQTPAFDQPPAQDTPASIFEQPQAPAPPAPAFDQPPAQETPASIFEQPQAPAPPAPAFDQPPAQETPAPVFEQPQAPQPPVFDQPPAQETPVQAGTGDMGGLLEQEPSAGMEFEIPGMGGQAETGSQPVEEFPPAAPASAPAPEPPLTEVGGGMAQDEFGIPPAASTPPPQAATGEIPEINKEELMYKVEDKLTLAIKEILWDVVPQMAEKIIKDEISKLKEEVDKSFEYLKE